jgi:hypothetical protein
MGLAVSLLGLSRRRAGGRPEYRWLFKGREKGRDTAKTLNFWDFRWQVEKYLF